MTLRDDLIAAKALIDTPEKFMAFGMSRSAALYEATTDWHSYFEADQALARHRVRGTGHASLMDQFDRAIAAERSK